MTNRLVAMYNLDGKEKHNTPWKIAFRHSNLIKIIIGKFIDKTKIYFFLKLLHSYLSLFFAFLNHDISDEGSPHTFYTG